MKEWRQNVFRFRSGHLDVKPGALKSGNEFESLLVLDSWRPHRQPEFIRALKEYHGVKVAIIPGGMTPLLQPADISWNYVVKNKIKSFWREWMAEEIEKSRTDERIKRPSYALICKWCLDAWVELDKSLIINSFKYANLGVKSDFEALHHKLLDLITSGEFTEEEAQHTGLTDESDTDTVEETLDFEDDVSEPTPP